MTYRDIPDSEIDPGSPITNALMTALRDNLEGAFDGESPFVIDRAAIGAASSGIDGAWVDATVVTGLGFFEPSSIALTAGGLVLPPVCIARVNGDVNIATGITMAADTIDATELLLAGLLDQIPGTNGVASTGSAVGGVAQPISGAYRFWNRMRGICGGKGGSANVGATVGGDGGGVLILLVDGDVTLASGAKITVNGVAGAASGGAQAGGGAGGTLIIVATGTISGGTYEANGGLGWDLSHGPGGGGGGGGYVALIASAYGTAPTLTANGGTTTTVGGSNGGGGGGSVGAGGTGAVGSQTTGGSGLTEQITLTEAQIRSLLLRSY